MSSRLSAVVLAMVLTVLAGCGTPGTTGAGPGAASGSSPSPPALPTLVPISQSCRTATVPAGIEQRPLLADGRVILNTAWLGSGETVAVLLHQTDGDGLCGFLFYAEHLAKAGVRVALLDLCGYGQSACGDAPVSTDPVAQVRLVTEAARSAGARRVVLVGASMGGSLAVTAAAAVRADALVDLSGPAQFDRSDVSSDAPTVTMPALIAFGRTDPADLAAVRRALPTMPTKDKTLLVFKAGHGYDLLRDVYSGELTPLADRVARFVSEPGK